VKIPEEILEWDFAARKRYADTARKGTQTIHRARAMIVGLEVHEDIFEIFPDSDCLKGKNILS
jgi:hypothetical protein